LQSHDGHGFSLPISLLDILAGCDFACAVFLRRICLALVGTALCGCGRSPTVAEVPPPAPPTVIRDRPIDVVVVIDNSGSISANEQALVRETAMLLGDLAEVGDQVSAVAFGESASKVAVVRMENDGDRNRFRQQVRARLTFQERRSDIRAGLALVAKADEGFFRPAGESRRVVMVMSDGKLEPWQGSVTDALEQMKTLLREDLKDAEIYGVALGDKTSRDRIPGLDQPKNGVQLMSDVIARIDDRFFHARRIDEILDAAMLVVGRAKGLGQLGSPQAAEFRIDRSVEQLLLVVRKRSTDGRDLCRSADIRVATPQPNESLVFTQPNTPSASSVYWSSEYSFFDLIRIRQPKEGNWKVTLNNGKQPQVLSRIVSPVELQVEVRRQLFANESAELMAWIHNRKAGDATGDLYRLQAQIDDSPTPGLAGKFLPMAFDQPRGRYVLDVPAGIGVNPGRVRLALVAEKRESPGSGTLDPWFIRRSSPLTLDVQKEFVSWNMRASKTTVVPVAHRFRTPWLFGATLAPAGPAFLTPPDLKLEVLILDQKSGSFLPFASETTALAPDSTYRFKLVLGDPGVYRYRYHLNGNTKDGPFGIKSPWFTATIRCGWEWVLGFLLLVLVILCLILRLTATLRGEIGLPGTILDGLSTRQFDSRRDIPEPDSALLANVHFLLTPHRCLLLRRKAVCLTVIKGPIQFSSDDDPTIQWSMSSGSRALPRGEGTMTVKTERGELKIQLSVRVA
jgi:hypothetical protein